jgi:peptidoglycan/xylan/chitin deacetylase (PgdA/CDA1 family)
MRRLLIAGVCLALSGVGVAGASTSSPSQGTLPIGCKRHGPPVRYNGHRDRKRVAIGFDDGPAADTGAFVRELKHLKIHATFFEIGEQVPGNSSVMKKILATGNEIGNHSMHHVPNAGYSEIHDTQRAIKNATGFTPCVFRPPDGVFNSATVDAASSLGLTTVVWDVDPRDWSTPGTEAIKGNVVGNVKPGSIVVMHDGGGPRGQTLAALPGIVAALRHRGYEFVTVSELLGNKMIYPGPPPAPPTPAP